MRNKNIFNRDKIKISGKNILKMNRKWDNNRKMS